MICIVTYVIGCLFQLYIYTCYSTIDRACHIRLIRSNRLRYYRSSHTFLITDLFAAYHTHLVILNRLCSLVSTQTVHPSELHAIYCTYLHLAPVSFVFPNHKQFIRVNNMLYITHTFIWLAVSFVLPNHKQLILLKRMPSIAHTFI